MPRRWSRRDQCSRRASDPDHANRRQAHAQMVPGRRWRREVHTRKLQKKGHGVYQETHLLCHRALSRCHNPPIPTLKSVKSGLTQRAAMDTPYSHYLTLKMACFGRGDKRMGAEDWIHCQRARRARRAQKLVYRVIQASQRSFGRASSVLRDRGQRIGS